MKTLLIMTVGKTDVQLVVDGQRRKLDGNTCGTLQDELVKRHFTFVDTRDTCKPKKDPSDSTRDKPADSLPEGELKICTPKLDAVLRFFGESLPTNALVFDTRRACKSDPRHAGAVLEQKLKDRGVSVRCHTYLHGEEKFDDRETPEDAVVRRSVVVDLSKVIAKEIETQKPTKIVLATVGGPPPVTDVINELVRLHAVERAEVIALDTPENALIAVEEKFHPAAGYRARWHALSLVEKGNLLGAWGAVSHLKDAPGQEWTQVIEWLALFASSLPLPTNCDLAVLSHQRMAVRSALRVELALRAGDIPRAVHGTVAFFEAALWDKLSERLERSSEPKKRRYFKVKKGVAPTGEKLLRQGNGSEDDRKCPFELKEMIDGVPWYWVYDGDGGPAARLAKYFLKSKVLAEFDKILGSSIRALRNDIAHDEPTPSLMDDARRQMQEATLWSSSDTFLSQPLVQDVLRELGESVPSKLLEGLLAEVRRRLIEPTATWSAS